MKLKRATFRHIEAEIYNYDETIQAIQQLRDDIILSSRRAPEMTRVSGGEYSTSEVERRATKLADSLLLREMERITKAIRDTYARAKDQGRQVVWLKYGLALEGWQPPAELAQKLQGRSRFDTSTRDMAWMLGVDESTFHRYRTGFVYGIAEKLGWW